VTHKRPGPDPDTLKIEGKDWEATFKRALSKKRPKTGWPDRAVKPRKKRRKGKRKK
jgi:hypothetical protein